MDNKVLIKSLKNGVGWKAKIFLKNGNFKEGKILSCDDFYLELKTKNKYGSEIIKLIPIEDIKDPEIYKFHSEGGQDEN